MKTSPFVLALLVVSSIALIAGTSFAQTDPAASPSPAAPVAPPAPVASAPARAPMKLTYKPPAGAGNIPTRVSGGARGGGADTSLTRSCSRARRTNHSRATITLLVSIEPCQGKVGVSVGRAEESQTGPRLDLGNGK